MARKLRFLVMLFAIVCFGPIHGSSFAQPRGKDKKEQLDPKAKKDGKEHKVKQQKHQSGKDLVGDKIKKDGRHAFHQHGKATASVTVKGGKIAGITVVHSEKGNVPVTKYKSTKKLAESIGVHPDSLIPAQTEYLGLVWIGYGYIDDYGYEIIYWFPYDMIYDGDTGAVEFIPIE